MNMDEPTPIRILGIGGSMRQGSQSLKALKAALALAEASGAQTVLADVRELALPVYSPELPLDAYPPTFKWLLQEARAADGYILCSPTYHGTITGSVKNVLDALDFLGNDTPAYFGGKVVGLIGLGGGAHNVINSLHHAARALNGLVVPTVATVPGSALAPDADRFDDAGVARRVQQMIDQMLELARRLKR